MILLVISYYLIITSSYGHESSCSGLTQLECDAIKVFKEQVPQWLIPENDQVSAPVIVQKFENQTCAQGENVSLTCSTTTDRHAIITFFYVNTTSNHFKALKILDTSSDRYQVEQVYDWNDANYGDQHIEKLTILNVNTTDSGLYVCLIGNYLGIRMTSGYLTVVSELINKRDLRSETSFVLSFTLISLGILVLLTSVIILIMLSVYKRREGKSFEKSLDTMKVNLLYPYLNKSPQKQEDNHKNGSTHTLLLQENNELSSLLINAKTLLQDTRYFMPIESVQVGRKLGEGAFGVVYYGQINNKKQIAIKTLKENANYQELKNLIQELEIMKSVGIHENIVTLLGVSQNKDGSILALVEYAKYGNLRDFLRAKRMKRYFSFKNSFSTHDNRLTFKDLVKFSHSISLGMNYLHSKNILHRDLAARNILVYEDLVIKIADFGLARDLTQNYYYKRQTDGRLPVKWMAIECLFDRKVYSHSDLWSFGVLLWEIYSLGGTPYPSVPVEKLYDYLKQGNRMSKPAYANNLIYEWMLKCWIEKPCKRPSFHESIEFFNHELTKCSSLYSLKTQKSSVDSILIDNNYDDLTNTDSIQSNSNCNNNNNNIKKIDENLNDSNYESASSYYSSSSMNNNSNSIYDDNMKVLMSKSNNFF